MNFRKFFKPKEPVKYITDPYKALLFTMEIFKRVTTDKQSIELGKMMLKKDMSFPLCNNASYMKRKHSYNDDMCNSCIIYRMLDKDCRNHADMIAGKTTIKPLDGVDLFMEVLKWMEVMAK